MSVPFLPLFNVNSGPASSSPGAAPGATAVLSEHGGGESFAQAMTRLQSKGRDGGGSEMHEPTLPEPTLLSASSLDLSLEFPAELSSGEGFGVMTVLGEAPDQTSLLLRNYQSLSEDMGDLGDDPEAWPLIPGFYGSQIVHQPIKASGSDEQLLMKGFAGGERLLPGAELPPGLARPFADYRAPMAVLEPSHLMPENVKPMLGQGDVIAQGAFKVASGDLGLGKPVGVFTEDFERARIGEEQKLAGAELKTVLHAERSGAAPVLATEGGRVAVPVQVAFGLPQWATQVAERTAMLASQNIQHAELKLDPPELGPLNVRITVNQEQASVQFVSANASVREALDQSVARLKELLQEQGLDLVDTGVSDQGPQKEDSQEPGQDERSLAAGSDVGEEQAEGGSELQSTTLTSGIDDFV